MIATSVSESLTQVLRWVYWWNSTEALPAGLSKAEVVMRLNTDFGIAGMSSQDLQAVVAAWQSRKEKAKRWGQKYKPLMNAD
jgi:hypothetical protein